MPASTEERSGESFRHEAAFYAGEAEFLDATMPFIRDGVRAGEPVLVVVGAERIRTLRAELGAETEGVAFADMAAVGANPARIIPAWRDFVDRHGAADAPARGIGEPIFPERTGAELVECHRHESLLNLAFADTSGFWLLCPYDTRALEPAVIEAAHHTHPYLADGPVRRESHRYAGAAAALAPFDDPLPELPEPLCEVDFGVHDLEAVRGIIAQQAAQVGLDVDRTQGLILAVHEVAANSVRHGGGQGVVRIWPQAGALICEVRDAGRIADPLADRRLPAPDSPGGRGLWVANQLCDLVELRSSSAGTTVRLHMRRT